MQVTARNVTAADQEKRHDEKVTYVRLLTGNGKNRIRFYAFKYLKAIYLLL